MNDEYIRKDVYDARHDHMLDLITGLHQRIDDVNTRIDDIKDGINRTLSVMGIFFTVLNLAIAIIFYLYPVR